jgi:hypothetical protein
VIFVGWAFLPVVEHSRTRMSNLQSKVQQIRSQMRENSATAPASSSVRQLQFVSQTRIEHRNLEEDFPEVTFVVQSNADAP